MRVARKVSPPAPAAPTAAPAARSRTPVARGVRLQPRGYTVEGVSDGTRSAVDLHQLVALEGARGQLLLG